MIYQDLFENKQMRYIIVGYGNIGQKRKNILDKKCIAIVDPIHADANYEKFIEQTIKSEYYCNFNIVSHLLHPRSNKILENFLKLMLKYKIPHIPLDRFVEWWVKREELEITNINYDNKKIEFEINNPKLPVTILVLTKDKKNSWKIKDNYFTPIQELKHKTKCKLKN